MLCEIRMVGEEEVWEVHEQEMGTCVTIASSSLAHHSQGQVPGV